MSGLYGNYDGNRLNVNGNNFDDNNNGYAFGMALVLRQTLMINNNLYEQICLINNLILAWRKARKHKTRKDYVIEFEKDNLGNLFKLQEELLNSTYFPKSLVTFILRDPKTRRISKSAFRDRIVHHAIVNIIEPIFDRCFIYDSCANRIKKGNLFALRRFELFKRKITKNFTRNAYCLKADIKHYFEEVNHEILIKILRRKIKDERVILLIQKILNNGFSEKGMPLGNLTSQFFANVYLNDLDYFVKHVLRVEFYIRYVDDFVILHESKEQLEAWRGQIECFLMEKLKLELHPQKSSIDSLSRGIDFVGFRNFWFYRLLRKRSLRKMLEKVEQYQNGQLSKDKILESFQGWNAYSKWANSFNLKKEVLKRVCTINSRTIT